MLNRDQKKQVVQDLREKIKNNKLTIFCSFERISTKRQRQLKKEFQEAKGEIFVTKRRLLQRAFDAENIRFPEIIGPVMTSFSLSEILPAKIIKKFPKKKEKLDFIGGILSDDKKYTVLDKKDLEELAILPTREEVLARLIGVLKAPISNLSLVLSGNIKKLSYTLANIRE